MAKDTPETIKNRGIQISNKNIFDNNDKKPIKMSLDNIHLIGDKILIEPVSPPEKTVSGLYLPPTVQEKEKIQKGYIVKVGPGYPIPFPAESDEPWKEAHENIKYIPLQVRVGDLALFLSNSAIEIFYNERKYFIVPHHAILMVERIDW